MSKYMTSKDVCEELCISKTTLKRLRERSHMPLPHTKFDERLIRYEKRKVDEWVNRHFKGAF